MLMSCSDAHMLRSGDFHGDDDNRQTDRQTDYFTPAHVHGVINCCLATNLTTGKTIYMIFYGGYMILY